MTSPVDQPSKRTRSLTVFYVVLGVVVALGIFGLWFWRTWTVWWFDADEAKRRQAEAAAKLGVPTEKAVDLGDGVKLELVLVPAGRFRMGSSAKEKDRKEDEKQHWVMITRPFYIGKCEVTQEQWEKVMGKSPSRFNEPKNPVALVTWDDCQEFLRKLNQLPALTAVASPSRRGGGVRTRLPTEAEWEWACRAGTRTRFCSGDAAESLADYAWFDANSGGTAHPVGEKKPNAWGLFDMHGNVWEWCGDWYDPSYGLKSTAYSVHTDPAGPPTGSFRVLRGGSWYDYSGACLSANRDGLDSGVRHYYYGLRVVLVIAGY